MTTKEGPNPYLKILLESNTPPQGVSLDTQTALGLLPYLPFDNLYKSIAQAAIESGFGLGIKNLQIVYGRNEQTEDLWLPLLKDEQVPQVTTVTHDITIVHAPSEFPDITVITGLDFTQKSYDQAVPEPDNSDEIQAAVLQRFDPDFFSPPSEEETKLLHNTFGLLHPSETPLAQAAQRLQTRGPYSTQKQALWIAVFSAEAWEEVMQGGIQFDSVFELNAIVPGTALITLDQNGLSKRDNPQQLPRSDTSIVADRIEAYLNQLLPSS